MKDLSYQADMGYGNGKSDPPTETVKQPDEFIRWLLLEQLETE